MLKIIKIGLKSQKIFNKKLKLNNYLNYKKEKDSNKKNQFLKESYQELKILIKN